MATARWWRRPGCRAWRMNGIWVRIDILFLERRGGGLTARRLEFAERLDRLVIGAADADLVPGDPLDFIGEDELAADFERTSEGTRFQARAAEEPPPMMSDQLDLLRLGLRLRVPFAAKVGEEVVETGGGFGG